MLHVFLHKFSLCKISPLHFADQLHNPIMIFHGEYDRTIPVEQAEKMEKALVKHNYDVSFEVMKKEEKTLTETLKDLFGSIYVGATKFWLFLFISLVGICHKLI